MSSNDSGAGLIASTLLLVAGLLFLVTAAKHLIGDDDPDAPPLRWMTAIDGLSPTKGYLFGAGAMAVGVKFWVFTLTAISVIGDADLGQPGATVTFLGFVVRPHLPFVVCVQISVDRPTQIRTQTGCEAPPHPDPYANEAGAPAR